MPFTKAVTTRIITIILTIDFKNISTTDIIVRHFFRIGYIYGHTIHLIDTRISVSKELIDTLTLTQLLHPFSNVFMIGQFDYFILKESQIDT